MNAKQLIEIARRADDGLSYEEQGILGQHILSTVRPDDNEPVTREWFARNGNFPEQEDRERECLRVFIHNTGSQFIYADRYKGEWSVMIGGTCLVKNPTVIELRSLLRGLRVPTND